MKLHASVCPQLNFPSESGCTLCCLCARVCGGYECGLGNAATPLWRLNLASLAEADTHRGKGTDASLLWRRVSLCLWLRSVSELGYIMAKCERSATASSAVPLSPNSPLLPILISNLFQTPQFLDSIPCRSFLHTFCSAVLALLSSFVVVSGNNEDSVIIHGHESWPISLCYNNLLLGLFSHCHVTDEPFILKGENHNLN